MKAPVTAGLKAFGGALGTMLSNTPFGKMASALFGDNNPLAQIAGMFTGSSSSGGSSGGAGASGGGTFNGEYSEVPKSGSAADAMVKAIDCPVTSGWGWREHPVYGDRRFHCGMDFGAPEGTKLPAIVDGKIVKNRPESLGDGYGNSVIFQDKNGNYHFYAHCSQLLAKEGDNVKAGDIIAVSGNTGTGTGAHLHYGIYDKSSNLDALYGEQGCINNTEYMIDGLSSASVDNSAGKGKGRKKIDKLRTRPANTNSGWMDDPTGKNAIETIGNLVMESQNSSDSVSTKDDGLNIAARGKYGKGYVSDLQEKLMKNRYVDILNKIARGGTLHRGMSSTNNSTFPGIPIMPKKPTLKQKNAHKNKTIQNPFANIFDNIKKSTGDFFNNIFKTNKKKTEDTPPVAPVEETETKTDDTKVTNRTKYDFDNMTLDEMKAAYETIDSSVVSENNIPDWDNDNLSVIRSKMKAVFKNINNTITAKEEDKPEEKKPETNNNSLGISKEAAKDIKDKANKLVSGITGVTKKDKDTKKKEEEKIDYTTTEKAPNGKTYEENDIKYLMNNGYTKEDAIKFLATHEKYTKKEEKTSTGAVSNKSATEKKEITNPSDNISIQMLEAQNRTNELLSAILQAITNNTTDSTTTQKTNESTVKDNKIKHLKEKFNDAKTTIGMILSPSQVGLGREFSGGSTSSSASKIIPALNALTTM
jgi:murein DD-endopeptidase MepM/ murein hydrolase activator NlpD